MRFLFCKHRFLYYLCTHNSDRFILTIYRGIEQLAARRAHNPEVGGSSPPPATKGAERKFGPLFFCPLHAKSPKNKTKSRFGKISLSLYSAEKTATHPKQDLRNPRTTRHARLRPGCNVSGRNGHSGEHRSHADVRCHPTGTHNSASRPNRTAGNTDAGTLRK